MPHFPATSIAAFLIAAITAPAIAADLGHGKDIADRWCAACHVVAGGQPQATEAPSFQAIADRKDLDAARLSYFLLEPHPIMPNMALTRNEAADLAAYIKSLAK